jgi:hypothetical protein
LFSKLLAMASSEAVEVIRLLDSSGKVIDSVAADYEDSFCLDTFGDLIKQHAALPLPIKGTSVIQTSDSQKRCFILARVQTWDHKQPGKAFYSYYNAFHLNKILFQTQVYLGKKLIHRLHVLNPLTNSDIIGNVHYFMIKQNSETKVLPNMSPPDSIPVKTAVMNSTPPQQNPNVDLEMGTGKPANSPSLVHRMSISVRSPFTRREEPRNAAENQTWTYNTQLVSEISDNDTKRDSNIFRKPSQRRIAPSEHQDSDKQPLKTNIQGDTSNQDTSQLPIVEQTQPNTLGPKRLTIETTTRRHSNAGQSKVTGNVVCKSPEGPISINVHRKSISKSPISPGAITRFSVPVPQEEVLHTPSTPPRRRRELSMVNSTAGHASFEKWVQSIQTDAAMISPSKANGNLIVSSPIDQSIPEASPAEEDPSLTKPKIISYDAVLFATDNDFLESSKTRSIFKDHACAPEDAQLFEMPPFTGDEQHESELPTVLFVDDADICTCCYTDPAALSKMSPLARLFHITKWYIVTLALVITIVLILWKSSLDNKRA